MTMMISVTPSPIPPPAPIVSVSKQSQLRHAPIQMHTAPVPRCLASLNLASVPPCLASVSISQPRLIPGVAAESLQDDLEVVPMFIVLMLLWYKVAESKQT